jgi:cell division protein ZapE
LTGAEPAVPGADHSIAAHLEAEVAAGRLGRDAGQQRAAAHLDRLSAQLREEPPSISQRLREYLRGAANRWFLPAPATAPLRGVYLWGGVGRGKTLLMDFFDQSLGEVARERTHFYRFMRGVHAELHGIRDRTDPLDVVAQRFAARNRLICLDEFLVADIADAMILTGLFEGLFRYGVTLVATSNVAPQQLYKDGLQRQRFLPAIDLIERHVEVVNLDSGIDYRLRQLASAPTYFDLGAAGTGAARMGAAGTGAARMGAATQFAERFAALAGPARTGRTVLTIEERPIVAHATAAGMVWFEFEDICEGPRSQNDYIELARLYHTIFISDVPIFTSANDNAARRFIMLIDELYDRNVNIVVSAAAAPAALYQGERLRFEFERAASRLIEMQTERYLAGEHRP